MSFLSDVDRASLPTLGSLTLAVGTTIDRFVIDELIAEGSTSRVYLAHDPADAPVVLKILRCDLSRPRDAVERFASEARACTELRAPNVPRLLGSGRLADGAPYLALTYFEGPPLERFVQANLLSIRTTLQLGAELANALADVHAHGFVHCDVQPSNVILCERGTHAGMIATGALIDLGMCRRLESASRSEPELGNAPYLSPEQLQRGAVGPRSDIFALGSVLYHGLTGRPPYVGTTMQEVTRSMYRDPIPPLTTTRADCPYELDRAIQQALRRDPNYRWASARRFAEELTWLQARYGYAMLRRWQDEARTPARPISDTYRISGVVPTTGVRRRS